MENKLCVMVRPRYVNNLVIMKALTTRLINTLGITRYSTKKVKISDVDLKVINMSLSKLDIDLDMNDVVKKGDIVSFMFITGGGVTRKRIIQTLNDENSGLNQRIKEQLRKGATADSVIYIFDGSTTKVLSAYFEGEKRQKAHEELNKKIPTSQKL